MGGEVHERSDQQTRRVPAWLRAMRLGTSVKLRHLHGWKRDDNRLRGNPRGRCHVCNLPATIAQRYWVTVGAGEQFVYLCDDHRDMAAR